MCFDARIRLWEKLVYDEMYPQDNLTIIRRIDQAKRYR